MQNTRDRSLTTRLLSMCLITLGLLLIAPAAFAAGTFAGVSLSVANQTVPPGGLLQMQVFITEPKPILQGSQKMGFSAKAFLPTAAPISRVRDGALFSPAGDADGVAVFGPGSIQVSFSSPLTSFGMDIDTPVMAFALPVSKQAVNGQLTTLSLDSSIAQWLDPTGQPYPLELKSGTLTVGNTTSVSNVSPGTGLLPAGTVISIQGIGFQPTSKVDINEALIGGTTFVSSTLLQVTLQADFAIEGARVRVITGSETVEYYPYQRTKLVGVSTHALVASSYPLFSHTTWTTAYLHPVLEGSVFTGLALQNLNPTAANITLQLFSSTGSLLATRTITLGTNARIVRDLAEYFPKAVASDGTEVEVTSDVAVQVLGLLGDDSLGTMSVLEPSGTP